MRTPTKGSLKIHFEIIYSNKFAYHIINSHIIFLTYSFGIETTNPFITLVVAWKSIPDSRPKCAKSIPVFRPTRRTIHTLWGGTCLYGSKPCWVLEGVFFVSQIIGKSSCGAARKRRNPPRKR